MCAVSRPFGDSDCSQRTVATHRARISHRIRPLPDCTAGARGCSEFRAVFARLARHARPVRGEVRASSAWHADKRGVEHVAGLASSQTPCPTVRSVWVASSAFALTKYIGECALATWNACSGIVCGLSAARRTFLAEGSATQRSVRSGAAYAGRHGSVIRAAARRTPPAQSIASKSFVSTRSARCARSTVVRGSVTSLADKMLRRIAGRLT